MKITLTATVTKTTLEKPKPGELRRSSTIQFNSGQETGSFDDFTIKREIPLGTELRITVETVDATH